MAPGGAFTPLTQDDNTTFGRPLTLFSSSDDYRSPQLALEKAEREIARLKREVAQLKRELFLARRKR